MSKSLAHWQWRRRLELQHRPETIATPVPTNGVGSRGNTAHLNLTTTADGKRR